MRLWYCLYHRLLKNALTKKINKTGLDLGELDCGRVQVYARAQRSEWLRPRVCLEVAQSYKDRSTGRGC